MPANFKNLLNTTTVLLALVVSTIVRYFNETNKNQDQGTFLGFSIVILGYLVFIIFKSQHLLKDKDHRLWFMIAIALTILVSVVVYFVSRNEFVPTIHLFISIMVMLGINYLIFKRINL